MALRIGIKISIPFIESAGRLLSQVKAYINRVVSDGGTVVSESDANKVVKWLKANNLLDSTELLYLSTAGLSIRDAAGNLQFVEKVYSLDQNLTPNDGTQTVELSQPRLVGGIAPRSKVAFANLNDEIRYLTHPEISFGAGDAWSVTMCVRLEDVSTYFPLLRNSTSAAYTGLLIKYSNRFTWREGVSPYAYRVFSKSPSDYSGKNTIITLTTAGDNVIKLYINGVYDSQITGITTSVFSYIFFTSASYGLNYSAHLIQSVALTAQQVADEAALLRSLYPEIESTTIGTQTWATRNFEAVATPEGNVIANVTENGAVEKVTQPIDFTTWTERSNITVNASNIVTSIVSPAWIRRNIGTPIGKWVKIKLNVTLSSSVSVQVALYNLVSIKQYTNVTAIDDEFIYKSTGSIISLLILGAGRTMTVNEFSVQELNWSNSTEIYDAVYAATSGTAAEKEYAALKESAMWAYHTNSIDLGAIYGKIYNGYGKDLLVDDIALASDWGYHVATEAELTALAALGGNALKYGGTNFWTTANGTNTTGLTALGGASRATDGTFNTIKATASFWCADSDKVLTIYDDGTAAIEAKDKTFGAYVRLVKD